MSVSETVRGIVQESVESMALAPGINGSNLQPRCRICRNDSLRTKVNDLLTTGASYAMVLRALGDDNAKLDTSDQVTIDSIRNHTARHFPIQNVSARRMGKAPPSDLLSHRIRPIALGRA